MQNKQRILIEKKIGNWVCKAILEAGYSINFDDGDGLVLNEPTRNKKLLDIRQTDSVWLYVYDTENSYIGLVLLVWDNGEDVIADYTCSRGFDKLMESVEAKINQI